MTNIVSLVGLSQDEAHAIRSIDTGVDLIEAGGAFNGEYAQTWPAATAARYVRGNVGITVPISSHPTCEFERTRRQWQAVLFSHGRLHFGVELAQKAG